MNTALHCSALVLGQQCDDVHQNIDLEGLQQTLLEGTLYAGRLLPTCLEAAPWCVTWVDIKVLWVMGEADVSQCCATCVYHLCSEVCVTCLEPTIGVPMPMLMSLKSRVLLFNCGLSSSCSEGFHLRCQRLRPVDAFRQKTNWLRKIN